MNNPKAQFKQVMQALLDDLPYDLWNCPATVEGIIAAVEVHIEHLMTEGGSVGEWAVLQDALGDNLYGEQLEIARNTI